MATTPKQLSQNQLTTGFVTQYTAPAAGSLLTEIVACNTGTVVRQFYISVVPNAGTAGVANAIFNAVDLAPNETKEIRCAIGIGATGFISAKASAATDVTLTLTGLNLA